MKEPILETVSPTTTIFHLPAIGRLKACDIDIADIMRDEHRLDEVSFVNRQTAPELLTTYNRHWLRLSNYITYATAAKNATVAEYNKAFSRAKLGVTDAILAAEGHKKTSADLREAKAMLDPRVEELAELRDMITALIMFLKGKSDAYANAFSSVKRILNNDMPWKQPEPPRAGRSRSYNDDDDSLTTPEPQPDPTSGLLPGLADD